MQLRHFNSFANNTHCDIMTKVKIVAKYPIRQINVVRAQVI